MSELADAIEAYAEARAARASVEGRWVSNGFDERAADAGVAATNDRVQELLRAQKPSERESFGKPGHCHSIDGELWHEPGECKAPECSHTPCCGYVERRASNPVSRAQKPSEPDGVGGDWRKAEGATPRYLYRWAGMLTSSSLNLLTRWDHRLKTEEDDE